ARRPACAARLLALRRRRAGVGCSFGRCSSLRRPDRLRGDPLSRVTLLHPARRGADRGASPEAAADAGAVAASSSSIARRSSIRLARKAAVFQYRVAPPRIPRSCGTSDQGPLAVAEIGGGAWVSNSTDCELWRIPPSSVPGLENRIPADAVEAV